MDGTRTKSFFSADGDYLPLIQEIMRQGKQVNLGAFSSGLNPQLPVAVDNFYDLDEIFLRLPSHPKLT